MVLSIVTRRFGHGGTASMRATVTVRYYPGGIPGEPFRSAGMQASKLMVHTQLKQLSGVGGGVLIGAGIAAACFCNGPGLLQRSQPSFCDEATQRDSVRIGGVDVLAGAALAGLAVSLGGAQDVSDSAVDAATLQSPATTYGLRADGSHGPLASDEAAEQAAKAERLGEEAQAGKLPVISLEEFQAHTSENSLWVAYGGVVYDVTSFAAEHPGGPDALYGAGGQDLEQIWQMYHVHFKPEVMSALTPYAIGTLSEESMNALRDPSNKENAAADRPLFQHLGGNSGSPALRSARRARWRVGALWVVTLSSSFWWCLRNLLRLLGGTVPVLGVPLAEALSMLLPCAVPGYGGAAQLPAIDPRTGKRAQVAVIGGGISGCSCAFSLAESGYEVTVYESRTQLGGNAQCATFPVGKDGEQKRVTQDLSVLYWAPEYYRNYTALLERLDLNPVTLEMPYVVHTNVKGYSEFYTQPGSSTGLDKILRPSLEDRFAEDFASYDRTINMVRKINALFHWGSTRPSFYSTNCVSMLPYCNPLNYISLRTTARLFGCSEEFWETVVRPFHGLNLTTCHVDNIPGTAFPTLDAIAPLHETRRVCTWGLGNSQEVFKRTTSKCSVKLDTRVRQVRFRKQNGCWQQVVIDDHGGAKAFDRVVLACPASAAANIIRPSNWMERALFRGVEYHDEVHNTDWKDWLEAPVHQDPSCLPEKHRSSIMTQAAFLIDIDAEGRRGGGPNVEFTHNLGSFSPSARAHGVPAESSPMFMTQSLHCHREIDAARTVSQFSAPRGHPNLSTNNMIVTQMLHLVQGRRGVYYCSNWTSPGNGHDLACTSGLAVASAIGAAYPLNSDEARRDHRDCRRFMWV